MRIATKQNWTKPAIANKKPSKGTGWAKYSRNRVNFKKTYKTYQPSPLKKDDSLDGVWEVDPTADIITYYTPQEWKKREVELLKQKEL